MLDPRMVAASTQILASVPHGIAPHADCITASSQGALMLAMSVVHFAPGSQAPTCIGGPMRFRGFVQSDYLIASLLENLS